MDDPKRSMGRSFTALPFSRSVEQNLLSDYKVVVLALSEQHVDAALQAHLASGGSKINISDSGEDRRLLARVAEPREQAPRRWTDFPPDPRDRVHQHH